MTERTMYNKCREYDRLKDVEKSARESASALLEDIKRESGGITTVWLKLKAVFTTKKSYKLGYTAKQIAEQFPDIFEKLGGTVEEETSFKGIFKT